MFYARRVPAPARALTGLALAVAVALTVTACSGDDPTRDQVAARIRADPQLAGSPATVVDCLTDWFMDSATARQRKAFVDSRADDPAAPRPPDDTTVTCLKEAA